MIGLTAQIYKFKKEILKKGCQSELVEDDLVSIISFDKLKMTIVFKRCYFRTASAALILLIAS